MTDTAPAVWGRNRPLFEQQLATGHRFATQVAERFRDFGLTADVTEMALAETDAERANFHDEFDLTVEGRRIEVKSRSLKFTGPADSRIRPRSFMPWTVGSGSDRSRRR